LLHTLDSLLFLGPFDLATDRYSAASCRSLGAFLCRSVSVLLRFGVIVLATLAHGVKLGRRPGETFGGFFFSIGQAF